MNKLESKIFLYVRGDTVPIASQITLSPSAHSVLRVCVRFAVYNFCP